VDAPLDRAAHRGDKPVAAGAVRRELVGRCAAVALLADVPLSLALGWRPGAAHLVAVGSAWLYDLRLKWTWASVLPFIVSFGLVPVVVATALPGAPRPQLALVAAGAACGVAAHFANTLPDVAADAITGVRGLPQRIGPAASTVVAALAIAAAAALLVIATDAAPLALAAAATDGTAAVVVIGLALTDGRERKQAFRLVIAAVAVLVAAFVVSGGDRLTSR
jgi:4-hydroxybenzoate polyprenyltransferase